MISRRRLHGCWSCCWCCCCSCWCRSKGGWAGLRCLFFLSSSVFLSPVDLFATCAGQMLGCFGAGSVAESTPKRTHLFLPPPSWAERERRREEERERECVVQGERERTFVSKIEWEKDSEWLWEIDRLIDTERVRNREKKVCVWLWVWMWERKSARARERVRERETLSVTKSLKIRTFSWRKKR